MIASQQRQGVFFALSAFGIWGIMPLYFKQMSFLAPGALLSHRILWSLIFTLFLILAWKRLPLLVKSLTDIKVMSTLAISSLIIGLNWLIFIWAVQNNHMIDASLGYYINPIVNIALGMFFLKERLRRVQWIAVSLAFIGVLIQIFAFGQFPVIALTLACSFSIYGLIRKKAPVDGQTGLAIETLILLLPALIYLFVVADMQTKVLEFSSTQIFLILLSGPVTSIPLILFTAGAQRLDYSTMGFFQYIAPSIMFLCAIFIYDEPLRNDQLVTFIFIWSALVLLSFEALSNRRRIKNNV